MGLGSLNFDFGVFGFIIALGPPIFLLILLVTLPEEISYKISKWKDARRTKEGGRHRSRTPAYSAATCAAPPG